MLPDFFFISNNYYYSHQNSQNERKIFPTTSTVIVVESSVNLLTFKSKENNKNLEKNCNFVTMKVAQSNARQQINKEKKKKLFSKLVVGLVVRNTTTIGYNIFPSLHK